MSLLKKLKLNIEENDRNEYVEDETTKSQYFVSTSTSENLQTKTISESLLSIELNLVDKLKEIQFKKPVDCVYNPLDYAHLTHSMFVKKYCNTSKKILFLGLNPGPWGMAQTGVPFGEVNITQNWLGISGPVSKPLNEISCRQICGFECHRSEISGKKFWSLFQNICGTPENFFKNCYMHNYCPLLLMKNTGANVTPADLKSSESAKLLTNCDESLSDIIKLLNVEIVVGVGRFAQKRAEETVKKYSLNNTRVCFLVHPSPRIPRNEDWQEKAKKSLTDLDLLKYLQPQDTTTNIPN